MKISKFCQWYGTIKYSLFVALTLRVCGTSHLLSINKYAIEDVHRPAIQNILQYNSSKAFTDEVNSPPEVERQSVSRNNDYLLEMIKNIRINL